MSHKFYSTLPKATTYLTHKTRQLERKGKMPNPDELERLYKLIQKEQLEQMRPEERDAYNEAQKNKDEIMSKLSEQVQPQPVRLLDYDGIVPEPMPRKPILCLDFDGVIHSYTSGWKGADVIPDPPVEGALEFIDKASEFFDVQIFSSRSNQAGGVDAMWQWLCKYWTEYEFNKHPEYRSKYSGMEPSFISLPTEKPSAFVGLDDRVLTFNGVFPDIEMLRNFKPWNKK